jgi:hypothetical protein
MEPQVGEIWTSSNGWNVLLLEELDNRSSRFSIIYLEDGLISNATIDNFYWKKVA